MISARLPRTVEDRTRLGVVNSGRSGVFCLPKTAPPDFSDVAKGLTSTVVLGLLLM
jgi:hypothetical protein